MGNWQVLEGGGASGSLARVVIVTTLAILTAAGCGPEKTPTPEVDGRPVVVAAGDIVDCSREDDEATARLVGGIEGTILTLGDHAYPDGSAQDFDECYDPTWGQFKDRTRPSPGNHEYETEEAQGYFGFFGKAAGDPEEGYYSYDLGAWHIVALNSNCGEGEIRCGPGSPRGGGFRRTSPPTTRRRVPLPTSTTRCSLRGRIVPALNGWSVFGRSSSPAASTWCSTDTTTTTSVLPPRTRRGGRIPRMA